MHAHRALFDAHAERWVAALPQGNLYAPMAYLLGLPAKRVRPLLTLMACELFGGKPADALDEALGIEVFHNFTLMHDDIMDASPTRRGRPTVHVKWDTPTAILSGDAMLVKAHGLMNADRRIAEAFGQHALLVCEGQQLDMDFEQRTDVTLAAYTEMIRQKTAVLLACALRIGAIKAGASSAQQDLIGAFGEYLGLAFQLRDDLLDAFGDPALTGKEQGRDLRNGKKTWLLIRGLELEALNGGHLLRNQLTMEAAHRDVRAMATTLRSSGVEREAEAEVLRLEVEAERCLYVIDPDGTRVKDLRELMEVLRARKA